MNLIYHHPTYIKVQKIKYLCYILIIINLILVLCAISFNGVL